MLKKLLELIPLEQEKLYLEAQKQAEREELLRTIIVNIRDSLDINELKSIIVSEIGMIFDADRCGIFEYDKNSKRFLFPDESSQYVSSSDTTDYTEINIEETDFQPFSEWFISGKELRVPDTDNLPENTHPLMSRFYKKLGIKSNYAFLITYQGELLGFLYLN